MNKGMLCLNRKSGESIMIGDDIEIIVSRVERGTVHLAISAPKDMPVHRLEVWEDIKNGVEQKVNGE